MGRNKEKPVKEVDSLPLDVLGVQYKIMLTPLTDNDLGYCDEATGAIQIHNGLAPDRSMHVLLHEILHAVDFSVDAELTEKQIAAMSSGLFAVMRANQGIMRMIIGE